MTESWGAFFSDTILDCQELFLECTSVKMNLDFYVVLEVEDHCHEELTPRSFVTVATMSTPSLAKFITKRPWLKEWMMPISRWYNDAAGYRKMGLR